MPFDPALNYGRPVIRKFLERLPAPQSVLDLGCGNGADLRIVREVFPSAHQIAVDSIRGHTDYLASLGITSFPLDIERDPLPLPDESVDVILANQVLEHTKDIYWIFHEVSRCLRRGGHFIIGVPNLAAWHNRVQLVVGEQPSAIKTISPHVRGWTFPGLKLFIETGFPGGYRVIDSGGSNFARCPPPIARVLSNLFPALSVSIFLLIRKEGPYCREFLDYLRDTRPETNFWDGAFR